MIFYRGARRDRREFFILFFLRDLYVLRGKLFSLSLILFRPCVSAANFYYLFHARCARARKERRDVF